MVAAAAEAAAGKGAAFQSIPKPRSPLPLQAGTFRALTMAGPPPWLALPFPRPPQPAASLMSELFPESHNVLDTLVNGGGVEEH